MLIVTYGGHGGDRCGRQLREVLGGMGVALTEAMPGLTLARARIEANDGAVDPEVDFDAHRADLKAGLVELIAIATAQDDAT